jgi:hypothetical protein
MTPTTCGGPIATEWKKKPVMLVLMVVARSSTCHLPSQRPEARASWATKPAAMPTRLGGASGPLYAAFVPRIAARLAEAGDPSQVAAWAAAFRAGCDGIQSLGGKAGDRMMLDALLPAADAVEQAVMRGEDIGAVLEAAVAATKTMRPRLGRSSYIASAPLGRPDPGAYAVALWLKAIASAL